MGKSKEEGQSKSEMNEDAKASLDKKKTKSKNKKKSKRNDKNKSLSDKMNDDDVKNSNAPSEENPIEDGTKEEERSNNLPEAEEIPLNEDDLKVTEKLSDELDEDKKEDEDEVTTTSTGKPSASDDVGKDDNKGEARQRPSMFVQALVFLVLFVALASMNRLVAKVIIYFFQPENYTEIEGLEYGPSLQKDEDINTDPAFAEIDQHA